MFGIIAALLMLESPECRVRTAGEHYLAYRTGGVITYNEWKWLRLIRDRTDNPETTARLTRVLARWNGLLVDSLLPPGMSEWPSSEYSSAVYESFDPDDPDRPKRGTLRRTDLFSEFLLRSDGTSEWAFQPDCPDAPKLADYQREMRRMVLVYVGETGDTEGAKKHILETAKKQGK